MVRLLKVFCGLFIIRHSIFGFIFCQENRVVIPKRDDENSGQRIMLCVKRTTNNE